MTFVSRLVLLGMVFIVPLFSENSFECRVRELENAPFKRLSTATELKTSPFFIGGDYLFWIAQEERVAFAFDPAELIEMYPNLPVISGFTAPNGHVARVQPHWDSGFRAIAGFSLKKWTFSVAWTRFETDAFQSITGNIAEVALPTWANPDQTFRNPFSKGSAQWKLNYNTIDFDLTYPWGIDCWLYLFPRFGIKAAWINEKLNIDYNFIQNFPNMQSGYPTLLAETIRVRSYFSGAGPLIGLGSQWKILHSLSIYGDIAAALLYGEIKSPYKETGIPVAAEPKQQFDVFGENDLLRNTWQIEIGMQWDFCFFKQSKCALRVGWEQNMWLRIVKNLRFYDVIAESSLIEEGDDMTLQGLTAQLQWNF